MKYHYPDSACVINPPDVKELRELLDELRELELNIDDFAYLVSIGRDDPWSEWVEWDEKDIEKNKAKLIALYESVIQAAKKKYGVDIVLYRMPDEYDSDDTSADYHWIITDEAILQLLPSELSPEFVRWIEVG